MKKSYYIKILDMRKKQYRYVMDYDIEDKELLLTDNPKQKHEYLTKESLVNEIRLIINSDRLDLIKNQIIIGQW